MYKFKPILKTLVWGTESWVLSGVPGSESVVAEGPDEGKTLSEVYGGQFPLLIKFIDAHDDLSIQVHPDDRLARERHGCNGKTEMWYVIGAGEGAHLMSGLKKRITPEEYVSRVQDGTITDVLCDYKVAPGDVFFIPAGRIHAIGGGCFIAEIQQTSDITYRIYDYGRPGLDGKPRQLHTEEAKDAIDYSVKPDYCTGYNDERDSENMLVRCPFFTTSLFDLTAPYTKDTHNLEAPLVVMCVGGECTVSTQELKPKQTLKFMGRVRTSKEKELVKETYTILPGECVLVPASVQEVLFTPSEQGAKILTSFAR